LEERVAEDPSIHRGELLAHTAEIVSAHVANNAIAGHEVGALIQSVFDTLRGLATGEPPVSVELTPAVPIRRSVTDDHLICLEDGKKMKMLKRHLMTEHGLTPEEYRARWGLKPDYPMVAATYSAQRQDLAKRFGLGRKPSPVPPEPEPKPRRRRKAEA
jgi:predicted transcriptional regulator